MTCCDLEKYLRNLVCAKVIFSFILVGGLLIGSDTCIDTCIMAKRDAIWLTFVSYGPVVTLKIQSKVQKLQI